MKTMRVCGVVLSALLGVAGCGSDDTSPGGVFAGAGTGGALGQAGEGGAGAQGGSSPGGKGGATNGGAAGKGGSQTGGAGIGGGAGHGGSVAAGQGGAAGQAGAGQGGTPAGGTGNVCPPTSFEPVPGCSSSFKSDCSACLCADPTCGAKWDACVADEGCSHALSCGFQGCSTDSCLALAGAGAAKLFDLQQCLLQTCGASCAGGQGGAGGAGGSGQAGQQAGGEAGQGQAGAGQAGSGEQTTGGQGGEAAGGGQSGSGQSGSGAGGSSPQGGAGTGGVGGSGEAGSGLFGGGPGGGAGGSTGGSGLFGGGPQGGAGQAGAGGSGTCGGDVFHGACGACLEQSCCSQAAACGNNCQACLAGDSSGANCASDPQVNALRSCAETSCESSCFTKSNFLECTVPAGTPSGGTCGSNKGACNPVTNAGCAQGAACDFDGTSSSFQCFPSGNTQGLCQACGTNAGYCQGGNTCLSGGYCGRFCCTDSDCGQGVCRPDLYPNGGGTIGVCTQDGFTPLDSTSLCGNDFHEPNDSAAQATSEGEITDCDNTAVSIAGAIDGALDTDWYRAHATDETLCQIDLTATFSPVNQIEVCVYAKCDALAQTVQGVNVVCPAGTTLSSAPGGFPGCCGTSGTVAPKIDCGGGLFGSDSSSLLVKVTAAGAGQCVPYNLNFHY